MLIRDLLPAQQWGRLGPTSHRHETKQLNKLVELVLPRQELGQKVSRIDLAEILLQQYLLGPDLLLHPLGLGIDMPQLTQTLPRADPHGRRRVRPHSNT